MHRFYVDQELNLGEATIDGLQIVHQLVKVLRMKPGESVIFFDGSGYEFIAEIILFSKESVRVRIVKKEENRRELPIAITLAHALVKKERVEWLLEKATEVGVVTFLPMKTERTVPKEFQIERARKIVREATEQSGRAIVPEIREPVSFSDALALCKDTGSEGILFHTAGERVGMADIMKGGKEKGKIFLFIGPEGGFIDVELREARAAGIMIVSPYPTILRAETAGVVFAALIAEHASNVQLE